MQPISRRSLLRSMVAVCVPSAADAASPERLTVDANDGAIAAMRYPAAGAGKRPAVVVLHGSRGVELKPGAYERHVDALAAGGIDAYLVHYFTQTDQQALDAKTHTPEARDAYRTGRFDGWTERVSPVITAIMHRPECSGRIGLLGFSLGGYVAAATAARDERVAAVAVMYGGMPDAMVARVKHLPPLLELHGEMDHNVPLAKGEELVRLAKALGVPAELVAYPGREHGFDFSDTDPMTGDAIGRVVRFFQVRLSAA